MKNLFEKFEILATEDQLKKLEKYYELLVHYNKMFNLTAITEREEVYLKHFVDSGIKVDKLVGNKLIDVGSGGGFPALVIKILRPDIDVTMLEATGKKCEFLKTVISELGLENCQVINARAEDLAKNLEYREQFDLCTARAVARLNTLLEYCLPFVKVGGKFVAYKGNATEEILEAKNALSVLGGQISKLEEYTLLDAQRALIYVDKIKSTNAKYPRGNGKERKSPL